MSALKQQTTAPRHGRPGGGAHHLQEARTDAGFDAPRSGTGTSPESSSASSAAELESILHELIVEHEQLLTLAGAQKKAMREASPASLGPVIESQNAIVQRVAELEKRRLAIVSGLMERAGPVRGAERPTLAALAGVLPAGAGERISRVGARLRELLKKLHQENAALRDAAASLATHMEAVMRQVAGKLSHAGTYGRRGTVETRVQVMSALDLRS